MGHWGWLDRIAATWVWSTIRRSLTRVAQLCNLGGQCQQEIGRRGGNDHQPGRQVTPAGGLASRHVCEPTLVDLPPPAARASRS